MKMNAAKLAHFNLWFLTFAFFIWLQVDFAYLRNQLTKKKKKKEPKFTGEKKQQKQMKITVGCVSSKFELALTEDFLVYDCKSVCWVHTEAF